MVKTFKNLLLQNQGCFGAESLHNSSGTEGLPKLLKFDLFYGKVVCFPMHLYGKKTFKNVILQNRGWHVAECLHISSGTGGLPRLLK